MFEDRYNLATGGLISYQALSWQDEDQFNWGKDYLCWFSKSMDFVAGRLYRCYLCGPEKVLPREGKFLIPIRDLPQSVRFCEPENLVCDPVYFNRAVPSEHEVRKATLLAALREAREVIAGDRRSLYETAVDVSGEPLHDTTVAILNFYDSRLATIDAAIQQATGGSDE